MRNPLVTQGIVLNRIDFQEADRILTLLTPDHGKLQAIAKGVRRPKSKLAGGIELFSISDITFLPGKKEIGTLMSSRLSRHYGNIVKDINRTMLGYNLLKRVNRSTEDATGEEYFYLLRSALAGLDDVELSQDLTELWFNMQFLKMTGHSPKLQEDASGNELVSGQAYLLDVEEMVFQSQEFGPFSSNHIKLLRLAMGLNEPVSLKQVKDASDYMPESLQLATLMLSKFVRL